MRKLHGFPGGLQLDGHKTLATGEASTRPPLSHEYVLPLLQHEGDPARAVVAAGDSVRRGQVMARAEGYLSLPIHAPTSGTISAIEARPIPHPSGLMAECIVLRADGRDEAEEPHPPISDPEAIHPSRLRNRLRECGVAGLGGAAFPTHVKLNPARHRIHTLILNGAQCEPYISCDDMLMRERAAEVVAGGQVLLTALQCERLIVAIEEATPEAIRAIQTAITELGDPRLELAVVPARYPEGGERQLIQTLTGQEVPSGGLPADLGVLCQNVATAAAAWRALAHGEALTERMVTVTGSGVRSPCNVIARIGTPVRDLIAHAGGYTPEVERLIMGGPMMGFALDNDEIPVVKGSTCVLAASREDGVAQREPMPCIRCGECAEVCPASLLPQQLYWHARDRDFDALRDYDLFDCIECGCCDLVCPSHIPLAQYFRAAKTEIWNRQRERSRAEQARRRHEFRQARLEREQAERRRRLEEKKKRLEQRESAGPDKADVADIISRARTRKKRGRKGESD